MSPQLCGPLLACWNIALIPPPTTLSSVCALEKWRSWIYFLFRLGFKTKIVKWKIMSDSTFGVFLSECLNISCYVLKQSTDPLLLGELFVDVLIGNL